MKLCKLKLKNLNSFHREIELDFEKSPLDDASLVAITGPTGAGKTTLLDAICVALYGRTPRLTGVGSQNPSHLISHGETDAYAEVHFVANGIRYLAEWSLRRKSSPKGRLLSTEDGKLISDRLSARGKTLGASKKTISEEITDILGLDFDAFKRSVMLAQGEFAAFLKAKDEERRTILEATAGVDIYDRLKEALNQKVRETENIHQEVMQKLIGIPDVTSEQIAEAENHLRDLKANADALDASRQEIRVHKQREMERTAWFSDLHLAEEHNEILLNQQTEIMTLKTELERADRANHLRPEKQGFDIAKSELEKADTALRQAKMELTEAQEQFDENQANSNEKDEAYQIEKAAGEQKTEAYREAKSDVESAHTQFQLVEERKPSLQQLEEQIDALSTELSDKRQEQATLEEDIHEIETFLTENPLPSDRQPRLIQAKELLVELRSHRQQHTDKLDIQSEYTSEIGRSEGELKKLSENRKKLLTEKENAEAALAKADTEFQAFQASGSLEDWRNRREQARQALSIAQSYEVSHDQLREGERNEAELQEHITTLDESLDDLKKKLEVQFHLCKHADAEVARLEAEKELALLANPINQLRRQLEPGQPCRVCGATEHPCADEVELGGKEQLEIAQNALDAAETKARDAQGQNRHLEQEQTRLQQNRINIITQIDARRKEIEHLKDKIESAQSQWRARYETADISSEWLNDRISEADAAIDNLVSARDSYNQASNQLETVSERLTTCERDIARETSLLKENQQKLQTVTDDIEDLTTDIESSETGLRELLPDTFHETDLEEAVNQFADKIETLAAYEQGRNEKQNALAQCNIIIREKERDLETEQEHRQKLEVEIEGYQNEGDGFLNAAREKTDGLTTIDEIDTAIKKLAETLQVKSAQRDEAEQLLQESQTELTKARTNHSHHLSQHTKCSQNFETAKQTYLERLSEVGFDSLEAHDSAFREEAWRQRTSETITAYTEQKQRLEVDIARLRAIFEENPFKPELLETIEAAEQEIGKEHDEKQQEIGVQRTEINRLKDALAQRTVVDTEMQESGQELERWQRLQNTIPANNLRDFALDIMFKQVSRIANAQLQYLTSERYQLRVEGIGRLTIVDRWNANDERPVETLSGGESFLTSLALALALSELSRGRSQIHSLFLDEGFGTLDSETLDVAIAALEGLQMQGRSIFLISHIGELTRRIPVRIAVEKMGNGSSRVQVRG